MSIYAEAGALVLAVVLLYVLYYFIKNFAVILANSVFGLVSFILLNSFLGLGIPIDIWTIGIVGIGGFGGLIVVLILHFLGLAF
ncbi:MAG: pro-sigmaK processing inhibitor BofA family protein [Candidatus Micrarchaeota archaeon]